MRRECVDVLLAGVPAERSLPAAVVPAVLAAGGSVQVQQDADAVPAGRAEGPVDRVERGKEGRVLLGDPVADGQADGVDPVRRQPLEILGGDPCLAVPLQAIGGPGLSERLAERVLVLGLHAGIDRRRDPFLERQPAAEVDPAPPGLCLRRFIRLHGVWPGRLRQDRAGERQVPQEVASIYGLHLNPPAPREDGPCSRTRSRAPPHRQVNVARSPGPPSARSSFVGAAPRPRRDDSWPGATTPEGPGPGRRWGDPVHRSARRSPVRGERAPRPRSGDQPSWSSRREIHQVPGHGRMIRAETLLIDRQRGGGGPRPLRVDSSRGAAPPGC